MYKILRYALTMVLPFFILIRGSIVVHEHFNPGPWLSVVVGVVATTILLFIYITFIYSKLTKRLGDTDGLKRRLLFAFFLVLGYSFYSIFYVTSDHVKTPELKDEIHDLHPILRLAASTWVWVDPSLIITDGSRKPEDYKRMGLPTAKNSLHYPQPDGYAYALDIRTNQHSEIRNQIIRFYFWCMGFNTLRHVGTDDHLHISLSSHYRKGAI